MSEIKRTASSAPPVPFAAGHTLECDGIPPLAASAPEHAAAQASTNPQRRKLSSVVTTTSDANDIAAQKSGHIDREELVSDTMRLRFLSTLGAVAWASFFIQDWMVVRYGKQGDLSHFAVVRAIGMFFVILVIVRMRIKPPPGRRELDAIDVGIFSILNGCIALLSLVYDGISSRYAQGVLITLASRASVLAAPWRRGVWLLGIPTLAFPATLLISSAFSPEVWRQFSDPQALSVFTQNLYVHALTLVIGVWGGHGNWAMRRQLFESRSIGKYSLKRRIGRGGMGEVWIAHNAGLHQNVALKILRHEPDSDSTAVRRFEQEVAAMTQLTHPNTVRVFDYGVTEDGISFYAMELLEGVTLKELVETSGPLELPRALRIAHRISRALAEAHQLGIVHRDVKPENVFITHAGNEPDFVKVLDFGIAKLAGAHVHDSLTRTGAIFGTPAYMSPEAARGTEAGPAADVYGVGALLFYMLTGKPPFTGRSPTEVLLAQLERSAPLVSATTGVVVGEDVEAIVRKCLAKSASDRFADATELSAAIGELRRRH